MIKKAKKISIKFAMLLGLLTAIHIDAYAQVAQSMAIRNAHIAAAVDQLQAVIALLEQAREAQPAQSSPKVHFQTWVDINHHQHAGVINDLKRVQSGLIHAINYQTRDPHALSTINGHYIN